MLFVFALSIAVIRSNNGDSAETKPFDDIQSGTIECHKTKDILYVKELLGHKKIESTLMYTQLARFEESEEFPVKTASTPKKIKSLLEVGFEYVCEKEGLMFFRKRK